MDFPCLCCAHTQFIFTAETGGESAPSAWVAGPEGGDSWGLNSRLGGWC